MAEFASLLDDTIVEKKTLHVIQPKKVSKTKQRKGLGCENCALNNEEQKKFITKVHNRKIMIIGTHVTEEDEEEGKLFKGRAGRFLWKELQKVGIERTDCDLQVSLRCNPGYNAYIGNKKFKQPLRCCSEHTEKALAQSHAKLYIIFGIEAAKQVLGKEYRVGTQILWSEKLNAKVYCLYQPSFYLRSTTKKKDLVEFRKSLNLIAEDLKKKTLSKYQYIDEQDYKGILTGKEAKREAKIIRKTIKAYAPLHTQPLRLYCDEEAGKIKGEWETLCIGTCIKPGRSRVFVLHPKYVSLKERKKIRLVLKDLLEDASIEKAFHHGSYDVPSLEEKLGIIVEGFHFDTNYSTYLYNTDLRNYGLDDVGLHYFPEFGEYKTITLPECLPDDFDLKEHRLTNATPTQIHDYIRARGLFNYAKLPLDKLIRYNGADCDLGKRLELKTQKSVSLPLLSIYTDVSFVLDSMTSNGPWFDYKQFKKINVIIPPQIKALLRKLKKYSGKKDFNPNSPPQVAEMIFDKLKLQPPPQTNKERRAQKSLRSVGKNVLEFLSRKHEAPKLLQEYRRLNKMKTTYLDSYGICADNNGGRLKTKWWLTGTRTGRLSSGGGKNKKADLTVSVVNLQNVHGDQQLQDMLVPDKNWRKLYLVVKEAVELALGEFELTRLRVLAKDKNKQDEFYKFQEKCYKKLSESLKFKRAVDKILKKYGNIRLVLGFDQGQVEVRVMAQASGDENLIRDCLSGDIHSMVGHRMTGWPVKKIKKDKKTRTITKQLHFGILFGLSAGGAYIFIKLKDPDTKLTEAQVIDLVENYFKAYPKVAKFIDKCRLFVEEHGYIENMFGFKRPLGNDDKYSEDDEEQSGAFVGNQSINCLDFKTEALTQRGWVYGQDLRKGDVLLTKNASTGTLEWQAAQDIKVYPDYDKPLMLFKSRTFNAASTLDHRWLVGVNNPKKNTHVRCRTTAEITENIPIHRTGNYLAPRHKTYSDDLVSLVGWYVTDGSFRVEGTGYSASAVTICQSPIGNPKKCRIIDELMERLKKELPSFTYRSSKKSKSSKIERQWHFAGKWGTWIRANFPKRELSPTFLTQLTKKQLNLLLHAMILGDGTGSKLNKFVSKHKGKTGKANCKILFDTSSKRNADMFQMLCSLSGRHASCKIRDYSIYNDTRKKYNSIGNNPQSVKPMYSLVVCRRKLAKIYPEHKKLIKNVGVWCPVVPNTYFVARRKGHVFVTGNTPIQGAAHQLMLMAMTKLKSKDSKYRKILHVPGMEVHDAIYWWTRLKDLSKSIPVAKELLEKEPLRVVKKLYPNIKWKIPLVVEGKAGFRLGDTVEIEEGNKQLEIHQILAKMFFETWKAEVSIHSQLKKAKKVA